MENTSHFLVFSCLLQGFRLLAVEILPLFQYSHRADLQKKYFSLEFNYNFSGNALPRFLPRISEALFDISKRWTNQEQKELMCSSQFFWIFFENKSVVWCKSYQQFVFRNFHHLTKKRTIISKRYFLINTSKHLRRVSMHFPYDSFRKISYLISVSKN